MKLPRNATAHFLACALLLPGLAWADDGEEALSKACPALAEWKLEHPRAHAEAAADARVGLPGLRAELSRRVDADQKAREAIFDASGAVVPASVKAMASVDAENLAWLKQFVAEHGFPTTDQVGDDGVANAFLLVQHADDDVAFQASVLAVLEARQVSDGIRKSELAMLTDRVLLAQGKKQRYGSQYDLGKDGKLKLKPTEDLAHLDERRERMQLPPKALYECALRASYRPN